MRSWAGSRGGFRTRPYGWWYPFIFSYVGWGERVRPGLCDMHCSDILPAYTLHSQDYPNIAQITFCVTTYNSAKVGDTSGILCIATGLLPITI